MKNKNILPRVVATSVIVLLFGGTFLGNSKVSAWPGTKWPSTTRTDAVSIGHKPIVEAMPLVYFEKGSTKSSAWAINQAIAAEASRQPDARSYMDADATRTVNGSTILSPYHAKGSLSGTVNNTTGYSLNTVKAHAAFLYNLALTSLNGTKFNSTTSSYSSTKTYTVNGVSVSINKNTQQRIVDDLTDLMSYLSSEYSYDMTTAYHQGYAIEGVYLHLLQDIYAHRAKVTLAMVTNSGTINYINSDDFISSTYKTNLISAINTYSGIPMIRLKDYLGSSLTFNSYTNLTAAQAYEDNPSFWSARYAAAKSATLEQISNLTYNKSFSFDDQGIDLK